MKKIAVVAINKNGREIAKIIKHGFRQQEVSCFNPSPGQLKDLVTGIFDKDKFEGIIFIMAMGIAVRMIAPYLKNKYRDPAVVVVDDFSRYAISLLSGHEGGANNLAIQTANILDAEPVITTATEALKDTIIGIGCRKGIKKEDVVSGIKKALRKARCPLKRVRYLATIDLKAKEKGLCEASQTLGVPLRIISRIRIKHYQGAYTKSAFVLKKIGIEGVCEPCALLAGKRAKLIVPKMKLSGLTVAIAREN
ncbi:MAG: cobalamin biosynthesis protein [Candidatus Omnitrophota bacterium]|nr:cobalamin biosynthesis protein [Candidatus Omnitrophota bacterium]